MSAHPLAPDAPLDQVEWRVQGKIDRGDGVQVVAYLDAPTVSKLLDDWVGPDRWKDHYELTGKAGTLWCHLSVKLGDEWITKEDIGTASDMEADKGLVSDAFKRVAMRKWGVGRNVFALPVLRITKFRKVERQGKDPQAYLTAESHTEIATRLRQLGLEDAAEHAAKAVVPDAPAASDDAPPPGRSDEHEGLMEELETLLSNAADVGADGDGDKAREYAATSPEHARRAIEKVREAVRTKLAADETPDDPSAGDAPAASSPAEASPPADAEQVAADPAWRDVAEEMGVGRASVLNAIRKEWPANSGWNKPNRLADVDRLAATVEFGPLVTATIEDLAAEKAST